MGNSLCKERVDRASNSKSPVDRVIGRCSQICPNTLGKPKHIWEKKVLETLPPQTPPLQSQPQKVDNTGWKTASLTVPDSKKIDTNHPIPPPRKKRPSMLRKNEQIPLKNGFKDVFIAGRSVSTDSMLNDHKEFARFNDFESMPILNSNLDTDMKRSISNNPMTVSSEDELESKKRAPLTRKVSKVGNKKSDKFFGENLSDCLSDEPIITDTDNKDNNSEIQKTEIEMINDKFDKTDKNDENEIDTSKPSLNKNINNIKDGFNEKEQMIEEKSMFIDNVEDSDEMSEKIRKEKGDLLFSLYPTDSNDSIDYTDAIPVEEEPIVPVKRPPPHICDDERRLGECLHLHGVNRIVPEITAPKKPQRDFTKYKKSLEELNLIDNISDNSSHNDNIIKDIESIDVVDKIAISKDNEVPIESDSLPVTVINSRKVPPFNRLTSVPDSKTTEHLLHETNQITSSRPMAHSEKILRRCLSSQSYLTSDLIEKIAQQANNLSLSEGYYPEDYVSSYNDGSALVSPNSKLHQKRTFSPQISNGDVSKLMTKSKENIVINEIMAEQLIAINAKNGKVTIDTFGNITKKEVLDDEDNSTLDGSAETDSVHSLKLTSEDISNQDKQDESKTSTISNSSRDSNNLSDAITESLKSIELNPLPDNDEMHISSSDEISKTIREFIDKDDINPQTVLTFLEEEFGDILYSQRLPENDKQFLDNLKRINDEGPEKQFLSRSRNLEKIQEDILENHQINEEEIKENEINNRNHNNNNHNNNNDNKKENEMNEITEKSTNINEINGEMPKNLNKMNKLLDAVISSERQPRRHSIDDLDSWFSPDTKNGLRRNDFPEKKRKREASLPGYLDADFEDSFSKEEDTSIESTATIVPNISPCPSPNAPEMKINENEPVETEMKTNENESIENIKNIKQTNLSEKIIDADVKGKEIKMNGDHSSLLKFLNVERSNCN